MKTISNLTKPLLAMAVRLFAFNAAYAVELMKWERLPLAVPLQVGQERVVFVDRNVRVGVPSTLAGKLRVQSTGGTLYLLASEPIAPTRIQLQDAETGALILMDIAASIPQENASPLEPIQIIEGDHTPVRYGRTEQNTGTSTKPPNRNQLNAAIEPAVQRETPVPAVLTRYAAQNLYAPLRTVEPVSGIARVNINRSINLTTLLPMLFVEAKAVAAWRLEDYFVTAVQLKNTSTYTISLDPRSLQGDFVAATFQHPNLGPRGDASDTTVVYLVTRKRGLAQSVLPSISQIDASRNINAEGNSNEK